MRQTKLCNRFIRLFCSGRHDHIQPISNNISNYRSFVRIARKPYFNFIYSLVLLKRRKTLTSYVGHVKRVQNFYKRMKLKSNVFAHMYYAGTMLNVK